MAPPWGLSTPRAPTELLQKENVIWSRNKRSGYGFAPYFAYTFQMVSPSRATPSKQDLFFANFPTIPCFILLGSPLGYDSMVPQWSHFVDSPICLYADGPWQGP